jgi:hypothetical protein
VQALGDVLGWLYSGLSDNDDLVAVQSKLDELANWMADSRLFKDYDAEAASLGEALSYVVANLRTRGEKAIARKAHKVIGQLDELEALSRSAAYDVEYKGDDPEFRRAASHWEGLVSLLEEVESRKILDRRPVREQD